MDYQNTWIDHDDDDGASFLDEAVSMFLVRPRVDDSSHLVRFEDGSCIVVPWGADYGLLEVATSLERREYQRITMWYLGPRQTRYLDNLNLIESGKP